MAAPKLLEYGDCYCSACWCQQPEKRHVDYSADNDQGYGNATDTKVAYDNLQLCEDCMKAGAAIVGMVDADERQQELDNLKVENDRLKRETKQAQNYADRLEDAFEHRAQPIEVDHRKKPRKSLGPKEPVNG
jgi:hypothetical protein